MSVINREAAAKCSACDDMGLCHNGGMARPCPYCQRQFYTARTTPEPVKESIVNETPETITDWANETFGPDVSPLRCAVRANLEMSELITAVTGNAPKELIAEECADVCIVLWRLHLLLDDEPNPLAFTGEPNPLRTFTSALEANLELGDLMIWISKDKPITAASVLGSVMFYLYRMAWEYGFELQEEINRKMQINRARQWTRDGTGIGYHVKTTA